MNSKCEYVFSKDGIDGEVKVIEDDRGVVVEVTPYFNRSDDRPTLCSFTTVSSDGTVICREVDKILGTTGRRRILDRTARVTPQFERQGAEPPDDKPAESKKSNTEAKPSK